MNIPLNFTCCLCHDCPKAGSCLRHLAAEEWSARDSSFACINPKFRNVGTKDCIHFISTEKQRCAKGMKNIFDNLPLRAYKNIKNVLCSHFSRKRFYAMLKGESLIKPKEQEYIASIFRSEGVEEPPVFEEYVEEYNWNNTD